MCLTENFAGRRRGHLALLVALTHGKVKLSKEETTPRTLYSCVFDKNPTFPFRPSSFQLRPQTTKVEWLCTQIFIVKRETFGVPSESYKTVS